jgi:hypothetical protein
MNTSAANRTGGTLKEILLGWFFIQSRKHQSEQVLGAAMADPGARDQKQGRLFKV